MISMGGIKKEPDTNPMRSMPPTLRDNHIGGTAKM